MNAEELVAIPLEALYQNSSQNQNKIFRKVHIHQDGHKKGFMAVREVIRHAVSKSDLNFGLALLAHGYFDTL